MPKQRFLLIALKLRSAPMSPYNLEEMLFQDHGEVEDLDIRQGDEKYHGDDIAFLINSFIVPIRPADSM